MSDPIRYTLRFPDAKNHYLDVVATLPATPNPELFMAVWTPGSYLIREYSQHVEGFQAHTAAGAELKWEKIRKNRWRIESTNQPITLTYRVYARTMGVQSNWVESTFAMLNGAPTFISLGGAHRYEITLELPAGWQGSYTGLTKLAPNTYSAPDYDTLVDCPIYAGSPAIYEFEAAARKHYLINEGEAGLWNGPESAQAVERIVREYHRMMGVVPYDQYLFLNMLLESGGGLEHKNSTLLIASRTAWRNTEDPKLDAPRPHRPNRTAWLDLVSHEFFHLWNVKRLRPAELGPFDYENENYTRTLWVAEGITTYYGPLALLRARLITREQYLLTLSREITLLQNTPGRLVQPLETSSHDAWIKLYRQNENSPNSLISYYTKGAVVAWLIDARIQRCTQGRRNLDDVMREAYARFKDGYTSRAFRSLISEVAGEDQSAWLRQILETTDELDYSEALQWFGLRFAEAPLATKPYLGCTLTDLKIKTVPKGTPAYAAGLNVDDEILAINNFRARPDALLDHHHPGDTIEILISRRGQLQTLAATLTQEPRKLWQLV